MVKVFFQVLLCDKACNVYWHKFFNRLKRKQILRGAVLHGNVDSYFLSCVLLTGSLLCRFLLVFHVPATDAMITGAK